MGLAERVAQMRLMYHANAIEVNNVLNQLHIRNDEKAERIAANHMVEIVNDILPRIYGQKTVDKLMGRES